MINKDEIKSSVRFADEELYRKVCGSLDHSIPDLEKKLGIRIIPRGNELLLHGSQKKIEFALDFFSRLENNYSNRPDKGSFDVFNLNYMMQENNDNPQQDWKPADKIFTTYKGKPVYPKTRNQEKYVNSLLDNLVSFAIGPAGTGKTFLSIAVACRMLQSGEVNRLILTRPAVEAGESLGFLPGDLVQKIDPYLRPIYDALYECIGFEKTQEMILGGRIEIAPIAFMRGRTLSSSFIILDEAQNCTLSQLKMFLTRFGKNSRMCLSGDITQIDLESGKSGFEKIVNVFRDTENIGVSVFGLEDVTRHRIVEMMVKKMESI